MYSISRVERETGISKDVLRMWERRYQFPKPSRVATGERTYSSEELERLLIIKRLMDMGHRPGRLMPLTNAQLKVMLGTPNPAQPSAYQSEIDYLISLLLNSQTEQLSRRLDYWQLRYGLEIFVLRFLPELLAAIGHAWQCDALMVHHEHWLSELLQNKLRISLDRLPQPSLDKPKLLLTTLPGEQHGLVLLMLENIARLLSFPAINLGVQTPVSTIMQAVEAHQVDILCLSVAESTNVSILDEQLQRLMQQLPPQVSLYVGGEGIKRLSLPSTNDRLRLLQSLTEFMHSLENDTGLVTAESLS